MDDKIINFLDFIGTTANIIALVFGVLGGLVFWFLTKDVESLKNYSSIIGIGCGLTGYLVVAFSAISTHNKIARKNIADRKLEK